MSCRKRSRLTRTKKTKSRRERAVQKTNKEYLTASLNWLLSDGSIFSQMRLHGNTKWLPKSLVCLAVFWAWSEARHLTDAYTEAAACCQGLFQTIVPGTYQGFMGALTRWTPTLMAILWPVLQTRMAEIGGKFWRVHGWVPIAFDGSRAAAPRTEVNERAFCAPNYGKGKTAKYRKKKSKGMRRKKNEKNKPQPQEPQAWITLLWHVGLRLPWTWRLGPSNSSERRSRHGDDSPRKVPEKHTLLRRCRLCRVSAVVAHCPKWRPFPRPRWSQRELVAGERGLRTGQERACLVLAASHAGQATSAAVAIGQGADRQNCRLLADERLGFQATNRPADGHVLQNEVGN